MQGAAPWRSARPSSAKEEVMRVTIRLFMAAILLTAAVGVVRAQQDASAEPPRAVPDVAKPAELPPIPIADPTAPAVEPALTADQSAPIVEPVVPATVEPAAVEKPVATAVKRVVKKTTKKPAEKPAIEVSESVKPEAAAAAAASTASVDTTANTPPPNAAASTAPLESIAPPAPAAKTVAVETRTEQSKSPIRISMGGWFYLGIVVVAMIGIVALTRRRRTHGRTSIVDLTTISHEMKPSHAPHR
jgi:outer membrane biosynthesis protein TonB